MIALIQPLRALKSWLWKQRGMYNEDFVLYCWDGDWNLTLRMQSKNHHLQSFFCPWLRIRNGLLWETGPHGMVPRKEGPSKAQKQISFPRLALHKNMQSGNFAYLKFPMSLFWPGPLHLTLLPLSLNYFLVEEGVAREGLKVTVSFLTSWL